MSQESCPDHEVVGRVVAYVHFTNEFKAAPVRPEDVILSLSEDSALFDLCPSLQVPKLALMLEVLDQVNKTKIRK